MLRVYQKVVIAIHFFFLNAGVVPCGGGFAPDL